MNEVLEKLQVELDKLEKKKGRIESKISKLGIDPKVAEFIRLQKSLLEVEKDCDEANEKKIYAKCACCNHLMVKTSYEYDGHEGRSYTGHGCIKCGIDQNLYERCETNEERVQLKYMLEHAINYYYNEIDLEFGNHYLFLWGCKLFQQIGEENKGLSDMEIVERMKINKKYIKQRQQLFW